MENSTPDVTMAYDDLISYWMQLEPGYEITPDKVGSILDDKIDKGFNAAGGLGLFFALTEVSCRKIDSYF